MINIIAKILVIIISVVLGIIALIENDYMELGTQVFIILLCIEIILNRLDRG